MTDSGAGRPKDTESEFSPEQAAAAINQELDLIKLVDARLDLEHRHARRVQVEPLSSCLYFYDRIVKAVRSMLTLHDSADYDWLDDGRVLLRVSYEAMLQLQYICSADVAERESRAQFFVDFVCVERVNYIEHLEKQSHDAAKRMLSYSDSESIAVLKCDAKRARERARVAGVKYGRDWYPFATPSALARHLGLGDEYDVHMPILHKATHSTSLGRFLVKAESPNWLFLMALRVVSQAQLLILNCFGPEVSSRTIERLQARAQPVTRIPSPD